MRPIKDAGLKEVVTLRRRVRRALALERVWPADAKYLTDRLNEIEARIISMHEEDEYGEEVS